MAAPIRPRPIIPSSINTLLSKAPSLYAVECTDAETKMGIAGVSLMRHAGGGTRRPLPHLRTLEPGHVGLWPPVYKARPRYGIRSVRDGRVRRPVCCNAARRRAWNSFWGHQLPVAES